MGNKQRLKTADGNEALFSKQPTVKRNGKYSTRKTRGREVVEEVAGEEKLVRPPETRKP